MNRFKSIYVIFLSTMIFTSCVSEKKNENINSNKEIKVKKSFRAKYAGNYTIEVKNISSDQEVEVYNLELDGTATWAWMENSGNGGTIIKDRKIGYWTADENTISISIQGNSGMIVEEYELKDGVLINVQLHKRFLKKYDKPKI